LWQKEKLLNLALQAVPPECRKVAWLDCDIIFDDPHWSKKTKSLLDSYPMVQLFKEVHYLPAQWTPKIRCDAEFKRPSSAYTLASGISAATCLGHLFEN